MKTTGIIAVALCALAGLVGAAPAAKDKRYMVYSTTTEEVVETLWTTTTMWIDADAEATSTILPSVGGFYEGHKSAFSQPFAAAVTTSSIVTQPSAEAAVPISPVAPGSFVTPSASPSVAPSVPITSAYVASTSATIQAQAQAQAEASVPTAYSAPLVSSAPFVSPAPVADSASAPIPVPTISPVALPMLSTSGDHSGDLTYYDVEVGLGSCGTPGSNSAALVALAKADMNNGANPNANPLCGKQINIYFNGAVHSATVHDTCPGCSPGSLDVTQSLFGSVAPNGDGRVHGVTWSFAK